MFDSKENYPLSVNDFRALLPHSENESGIRCLPPILNDQEFERYKINFYLLELLQQHNFSRDCKEALLKFKNINDNDILLLHWVEENSILFENLTPLQIFVIEQEIQFESLSFDIVGIEVSCHEFHNIIEFIIAFKRSLDIIKTMNNSLSQFEGSQIISNLKMKGYFLDYVK